MTSFPPGYSPLPPGTSDYAASPAQPGFDPRLPSAFPDPTGRPRKNPLLGRVALALAGLMILVACVSVIPLANAQAQLMISTGEKDVDTDLLAQIWLHSAMAPALTWLASILGSVVAMLIGLIAAITARGRAAGVGAMVAGFLTPVAWFACWLIILLPSYAALS